MGDIVRQMRNGKFVGWYVRYKDADGKRKMRASHQATKEGARRYLLEVESRIARGLVGIPEPAPPAPTVSELLERFLSEYRRPRIKDVAMYKSVTRTALRGALHVLGQKRIDAVQRSDIDKLRDELLVRHAPNSVRLAMSKLAAVFSWAVRQRLLPGNPCVGVETPRRQDSVEYLAASEVESLLSCSEQRTSGGLVPDHCMHTAIVVALHLGLRKGELFGLRWTDIDLEARRMTVARSFRSTPKSGSARHLRIPTAIVPVLAQWQRSCPRTTEGLVFPVISRTRSTRMAHHSETLWLPELLEEARCKPFRRPWHALRHTFASHFVMRGGNILALQKILGHSDIKMTLVYAHLAPDYLGEELERLCFLKNR